MLLRYSFEPRLNSRLQKRVWRERTRLTSPEVWAAATGRKGLTWFWRSLLLPSTQEEKRGALLAGFPYIHRVVTVYTEITNTACMISVMGLWNTFPNRQSIFPVSDWFKSQRSFVITRHGWPRKDFFKYFIIDVNCWASYAVCKKPFSSWTDSQILKLESRAFNGWKSGTTLLPNRHFSLNQYWL